MKHLLSILTIGTLTSCVTPMASYDVCLSKVESPANAKEQFGDTKVVKFNDAHINKYRYEDDYIDIVWYVSPTMFNFELENKSGHTIKINWDDISYVDHTGQTGRVIHSGIKFVDKNNSQPSTSVPKGAKITDLLLPANNVTFGGSGYSARWTEANLIPSFYKNKKALIQGAPSYVGKKMRIVMPIYIENVQNDYTFEFQVDKLLTQ